MNYGVVLYSKRKRTRKVNVILIVLILAVIFLIALRVFALQGSLHGKVIQVKDGDTVVISPIDGGQFFTCRLYGIDAPEAVKRGRPGQPYGEEAERELKRLVLGQIVAVETTGAKTFNREVCLIRKDGKDINLEMVRIGYAWAYKQYLKRPYASEYISAEEDARKNRRGLWKDNNPTPPWEWRKEMRF